MKIVSKSINKSITGSKVLKNHSVDLAFEKLKSIILPAVCHILRPLKKMSGLLLLNTFYYFHAL